MCRKLEIRAYFTIKIFKILEKFLLMSARIGSIGTFLFYMPKMTNKTPEFFQELYSKFPKLKEIKLSPKENYESFDTAIICSTI